jgi:hypothetical protein
MAAVDIRWNDLLCLVFIINPVIRFAVLVCKRNDKDMIRLYRIKEFVRKLMKQGFSDIPTFD